MIVASPVPHGSIPRNATPDGQVFETCVPARLDRLPWGRFHWLVVIALGITWVLDGLEVTLVGSLSSVIAGRQGLQFSESQVGYSASAYLAGAVLGAIGFGWLTDRLGRKALFSVTVAVYLVATILSGCAWSFWSFALFRCITGAGIGGEYAAVNATIQELIPARYRGFTDLVINGSFWIGAALGSVGALVALNPHVIAPRWGWRLAFVIGGAIGFTVLLLRRWIPESPRWLMVHGQPQEADRVTSALEERLHRETGQALPPPEGKPLRLRAHHGDWFLASFRVLMTTYKRRTLLGVSLMAAQAFCYNAVFFTYALVLTRFYGIPGERVGWFMLPFALGNFLGPLLLGKLFDTIGRKPMIVFTYALAGVLMAAVGGLFAAGVLNAVQQTAAWTVIFFFASAASSSAYLTVGENFPLEVRAVAIAAFYALGTGIGGIAGPALFGRLIESGSRLEILAGYGIGGAMMLLAAGVEAAIGVEAERRSLEDVAPPLSAA